jgi:hypothetical protein
LPAGRPSSLGLPEVEGERESKMVEMSREMEALQVEEIG